MLRMLVRRLAVSVGTILALAGNAHAMTVALSGHSGTVTASIEYYDIQTFENPSPGQFIGLQSLPSLYSQFDGSPYVIPLIAKFSVAPSVSFQKATFIQSYVFSLGTFNIAENATFLIGNIDTQDYGIISFGSRFILEFSDGVLAGEPSPVPIPAAAPLFAAALASIALLRRRRRT
jgi:hypothetical protein